jgi:DNA-binding transcriptional ArsR family regulator
MIPSRRRTPHHISKKEDGEGRGEALRWQKKDDSSDRIAELAGTFSDATRVRILRLLMDEVGGATTMDICTRLGMLQPRVSSHLSVLLKDGVVSVSEQGRQRTYSVSASKKRAVDSILGNFATLGGASDDDDDEEEEEEEEEGGTTARLLASSGAIRAVRTNSDIRQCRSCYDHLAGVAGVDLLDAMLRSGWLRENEGRVEKRRNAGKTLYTLTDSGLRSLGERSVDVEGAQSSNRVFAYGCLDWTERRPHLGGSLGKAILDSALSGGVVERKNGTRALKIVKPISAWIGE